MSKRPVKAAETPVEAPETPEKRVYLCEWCGEALRGIIAENPDDNTAVGQCGKCQTRTWGKRQEPPPPSN